MKGFNLALKLTENNRDSPKSYFDKGKLGHWAKEKLSLVWENFTLLRPKNESCKSNPSSEHTEMLLKRWSLLLVLINFV